VWNECVLSQYVVLRLTASKTSEMIRHTREMT
jgi:hypothetical protein